MITRDTTSADFFEEKYRASDDPWNFSGSAYELSRYAAIIRALDQPFYKRAFEPGCSVGVLTQQLAARCGHVDACDFSSTAVEAAQRRCDHLGNVTVTCAPLVPEQDFSAYDLVIISEIGYYFTAGDWQRLVHRLGATLPRVGTVVACHWLGHSADHIQSGDEVHSALLAGLEMECTHSERHQAANGGFRLETWRRSK